jgi:hypothetical protein
MALLDRFSKHRLPRTLEIKDKLDLGEAISEHDLVFLEEVLADNLQAKALVDRHPELQEIYVKSVGLYKEIMEKATQNENKG